ncbi:cellulose binding domain-containing protein, partial [Kibdelosporangium lantanae]
MRPKRALPAFLAVGLIAAGQLVTAQTAAAAVSCTVDYSVTSQWDTGFGASVTIKNPGTDVINGWNLTWTFPDGQKITQLWNGTYTQTNAAVSVRNMSYNGTIPAAGSVNFGFNGSKGSANRAPADFAVNGTSCVGPNTAPTVSLTSPANNSNYTVGQAIPFAATASDADGTISKVEFYSGTTLLGTDTTAPYTFSWTGAAAGQYSVAAKAYDDKGASTISSPAAV